MMHGRVQIASVPAKTSAGRFLTLDAMRGVAAIIVCLSHIQETQGGWYPRFAYLSVDLFFVLSGFVVARAYDQRLATSMTFKEFFWRRLARLGPMLIIGAALAALAPRSEGMPLRALDFLLNSLALPSMPPHHGASLMPGNVALWSLFFELWVANLAYGLLHRFICKPPVLAAILLVGALGMSWILHSQGWFNVGAAWGKQSLLAGLFRVVWGFFAGVALNEVHKRRSPPRVPPVAVLTVVVALLCLPLGGGYQVKWLELALPLLAFPALVYLGANLKERTPATGVIVGEASYALYAIHYPLLQMEAAWALHHGYTALPLGAKVAAEFALAATFTVLAWVVARWADEPAQKGLRRLQVPF